MSENGQESRLAYITGKLEELKIRFPVADIAKRTGLNKGNISRILKGQVDVSDNFMATFKTAYNINNGMTTEQQLIQSLQERIGELKETIRDLREDKKNLTELAADQKAMYAQLVAHIHRSAARFVKFDEDKLIKEVALINSAAAQIKDIYNAHISQ